MSAVSTSASASTSVESCDDYRTDSSALAYAREHLTSVLSWVPTTATRLSGGLSNYVYRIASHDHKHTAILKYYHTHTKQDNYEISQSRASVEYTAMSLISSHVQDWPTCVRVPRVIHFDASRYVLCMEDMGNHAFPLFQLLSRHDHEDEQHQHKYTTRFTFDEIATNIQVFLDNLFNIPLNESQRQILSNPGGWALYQGWMSLFQSYGQRFPELEPYIKQCQPAAPIKSDRMGVMYGDLWPNSIYLDDEKQCIWIIDFEIVRMDSYIAKGVTRDYQQMMENLWIMCENSSKFDVTATQSFMSAFITAFQGSSAPQQDWRTLGNGVADVVRFICLLLDIPHWGICQDPNHHKQVIHKLIQQVQALANTHQQ